LLAYTLRRLWQFVPTLAGVILLVFFLFSSASMSRMPSSSGSS